jgi:hypothetical protein
MKAIVLKSFGGPESFELCDVPKPVPNAGQVLVRVPGAMFPDAKADGSSPTDNLRRGRET